MKLSPITDQSSAEDTLRAICEAFEVPTTMSRSRIVETADRFAGLNPKLRKNPKLAALFFEKKSAGHNSRNSLWLAEREQAHEQTSNAAACNV